MAQQLVSQPGGTISSVFRTPKDIKAAYRLLDGAQTTHAAVCAGHFEQVRQQCDKPGLYLLIEDTSTLGFPGRSACTGLGPIGEDYTQGLWMHSTLAAQVQVAEHGVLRPRVLGLFDQQMWARAAQGQPRDEPRRARQSRSRESQRWARAFAERAAPLDQAVQWVYVADRESDIYEVFDRCQQGRSNFVIRAAQDRALADQDRSIFQAAADGPWVISKVLKLRRAGKPTREARLQVRAVQVTLRGPWRPGGRLPQRTVNVVLVQEIDPPPGEPPLRWVLLTGLPIDSAKQVLHVVAIYCSRWLIEEFHKALKTGLGVEKSQLSTARRIMALAGMLSIVACHLMDLKLAARGHRFAGQEDSHVADADPQMLAVLERKLGRPSAGWTAATVLIAIARLGGYLARRNDGPPGWLTIWRGWQTLWLLTEGYKLAHTPDG